MAGKGVLAGAVRGVPAELISAVNSGNCIAFVGAGFSAAAGLPPWRSLLARLAEQPGLDPGVRAYVRDVISSESASAHDFDRAAQLLADGLGRARLIEFLRRELDVRAVRPAMRRRVEWLLGIPFRAILTLNFDGVLDGALPSASRYEEVLRPNFRGWWSQVFWDPASRGGHIIKLHGDVRTEEGAREIVLAREDYRRRLYSDTAYATFLRTVFATAHVLYLGVSFADAYLNELRSEALAMLGYGGGRRPRAVAYAILNDVPAPISRHFREHEGIEILPFDTRGGTDFGGFDDWLARIHEATSPLARLGSLLQGRHILWLDKTQDAEVGRDLLMQAAGRGGGRSGGIELVRSLEVALAKLAAGRGGAGQPYDLILSMWQGDVRSAWGIRLLERVRQEGVRSPVIIFAGPHGAEERKRLALQLGAYAYCVRWETLFRKVGELFAPASETS